MATPEEFAKSIRTIGEKIEMGATRLQRKVALAVDSALVVSTPVDTGRARNNWLPGFGSPVREVRERFLDAGAVIADFQATLTRHPPGVDIWISNNVNYIGDLNAGTSPQAPAGFVQDAVNAGIAAARAGKVTRER